MSNENFKNHPTFDDALDNLSLVPWYSGVIVREQLERNQVVVQIPGMPEDYTIKYVEGDTRQDPYFDMSSDTRDRYIGEDVNEVLSFLQGIRFAYTTPGFKPLAS